MSSEWQIGKANSPRSGNALDEGIALNVSTDKVCGAIPSVIAPCKTEISPDFTTVLCSEYCLRVADGTHDSPKETQFGKPLVTSKNVKDGRLVLDNAYLISEDDYNEINRRSKVDQWDLLLTMIGTVGEVCVVNDKAPAFAIKNVGLLKCGSSLKAKWLYYFLRSSYGQGLIEQRKKDQLSNIFR